MQNFPIDIPENYLKKASKLEILPSQITEQFIRGSGKGGQKVNKTSSTVYLKHLPSGIEIRCQKHREQSKNRISAYKLLIDKLESVKLGAQSKIAKKIFKIQKQKQKRSKRAKEKILIQKATRADIKSTRKKII